MALPKRLSTNPHSKHYNEAACLCIDSVFVDGEYIPNCIAYDMIAGWALGKDEKTKLWLPKAHGKVTVTERR